MSADPVPRLLLFDIDGTLLLGSRRLRRWFGESLAEVFGCTGDIDGHSFSGKIDPQIVTELLSGAGVSADSIAAGLPAVRAAYIDRLEQRLEAVDLRLLPHVHGVLEALSNCEDVTLGLLTGNWEGVARVKLDRLDLNRFFPFGAFSDGHHHRRQLPPQALVRAAEWTGAEILPSETLIIGDSVLDVDCAHHSAIRAVAVATGYTSREDLEAAGADWTIDSLIEIDRVHPFFERRVTFSPTRDTPETRTV